MEDGYIREEDKKDMYISKITDVSEIQKEQRVWFSPCFILDHYEVKNGEVVYKPDVLKMLIDELDSQQEITYEKRGPENIVGCKKFWKDEISVVMEKVSIKRKRIAMRLKSPKEIEREAERRL